MVALQLPLMQQAQSGLNISTRQGAVITHFTDGKTSSLRSYELAQGTQLALSHDAKISLWDMITHFFFFHSSPLMMAQASNSKYILGQAGMSRFSMNGPPAGHHDRHMQEETMGPHPRLA